MNFFGLKLKLFKLPKSKDKREYTSVTAEVNNVPVK